MKPIPQKPVNTWQVNEVDMRGLAVRLDMLETHYRQPKNLSAITLNRAARTVRRWLAKCIPNDGPPPVAVFEALSDDLNTPLAIAEMHRLAKADDGKGLFAAMKLMGLIPGEGIAVDYGSTLEIKTLPIGHIPLVQWEETAN